VDETCGSLTNSLSVHIVPSWARREYVGYLSEGAPDLDQSAVASRNEIEAQEKGKRIYSKAGSRYETKWPCQSNCSFIGESSLLTASPVPPFLWTSTSHDEGILLARRIRRHYRVWQPRTISPQQRWVAPSYWEKQRCEYIVVYLVSGAARVRATKSVQSPVQTRWSLDRSSFLPPPSSAAAPRILTAAASRGPSWNNRRHALLLHTLRSPLVSFLDSRGAPEIQLHLLRLRHYLLSCLLCDTYDARS